MNKDVFKTIEELKGRIDEEINKKYMRLEEIEKMERISQEVDEDLKNTLESITEDDIKVFEYYKELINTTDIDFSAMIQPLTDKGVIELTRTITNVYVKSIYENKFRATKKEMAQLADMYLFVKLYNRANNNKEIMLEGSLFSMLACAK